MTSNPSLAWQQIHDVYYSLRSCYDTLNWSIGNIYTDYRVKVSNHTTLVALSSKDQHPSLIEIYSISGNKLWTIIFNSTVVEHIVDFDWFNEQLCVVLSNHSYRLYRDLKGNFYEYCFTDNLVSLDNVGDEFPLLTANDIAITDFETNQPEDIVHVTGVYIWGHILFLRLTNRFVITDLNTHKNYQIPLNVALTSKIKCINMIKINQNVVSLVLCFGNTAILIHIDLLTTSFELIDHKLTDGPFTKISVSPNGQLIALLNPEVSTIFVINTSFTQVLLEYDTSNDSSLPYQLEWCGNDAVVLSLRDEVKLLGPNQASISFFYDVNEEDLDFDAILKGNDELAFTIVHLKSEPDGVKILSVNKLEYLSRVPQYCINLYQIGTSSSSSILLDAINKLNSHSSKSYANINLLKLENHLLEAIEESLDVALYEFNPYWQKKILLAVSLGKAYCDGYNAEKYLEVLNTCKVLNQLRAADISIFLTALEVKVIGWSAIIEMLLLRDQYLLSVKILQLLNLDYLKDRVYVHWCCYKLRKEVDMADLDLFKIIANKLILARNNSNQVNYLNVSEISEIAFEEGRIELCKLIINLEPSMTNKIQQYLKYDELELALIKSFQYGEYDLAKLILLFLYDTLSMTQFFKILHQNELKVSESSLAFKGLFVSGELVETFWVQAIGKHQPDLLIKYYKQEDMRMELNVFKFQQSLLEDSPTEDYLIQLQELLSHSGARKNTKFYQYENNIVQLRQRLADTYHTDFSEHKSISSILIKLVGMHQLKQCLKIIKEFKVSPEKLWYLILETYASTNEFERLHQFIVSQSTDKQHLKVAIEFRDIVETCLAYKGPKESISVYINNCKDIHYSEKIQLFIRNNDLILAANEAYHYKDIDFLRSILETAHKLASDSTIHAIQELISKLGY